MKIRHQWMHVSRREFNKVGDKSEPGFPRMFPKFSSVLVRLIRARETHDERSCVGCAQLGRLRTYHHMQKYIYIFLLYSVNFHWLCGRNWYIQLHFWLRAAAFPELWHSLDQQTKPQNPARCTCESLRSPNLQNWFKVSHYRDEIV